MFSIQTAAQAKKSASALRKALAPMGLALQRSAAYEVLSKMAGYADWNAMSAALRTTPTPMTQVARDSGAVPSIFDVPFGMATSISVDGDHYDIHSIVDEVMEWFPKWNDPANPYRDDVYQTALSLRYEDDGLLYDKDLSVNTLLTAKWDAKKEAFVSEEGEVIRVFFRVQFGKALAVPTAAAVDDVPDGYRVYQTLVGTWRWSLGTIYGTGPRLDGTNLPTREEAVQEAIKHAEERRAAELTALNATADATGTSDALLFKVSDDIKQEYLESGCSREDAHIAINRLLNECGELFANGDAAWEFLMEPPQDEGLSGN